MSLEEMIMARWMKNHSPEEKLDAMRKMMPKLLETMSGEDLMTLMSQMMPEMMKKCWECMDSRGMIETMRKIMTQMTEHCLNSLPREEKQEMFAFCRDMLCGMEERFLAAKDSS
jgi:DNA-binding GntR family transcriptional regulator